LALVNGTKHTQKKSRLSEGQTQPGLVGHETEWFSFNLARGRRRIQMLHDLANGGNFVALKWAAEEREGRRHSERMSKTCCIAKDLTDEAKLSSLCSR